MLKVCMSFFLSRVLRPHTGKCVNVWGTPKNNQFSPYVLERVIAKEGENERERESFI